MFQGQKGEPGDIKDVSKSHSHTMLLLLLSGSFSCGPSNMLFCGSLSQIVGPKGPPGPQVRKGGSLSSTPPSAY